MSLPVDRSEVERALRESKDDSGEQNIGKAARTLGMSRRTLQNRMRSFGIPVGKAGRRYKKFRFRKRRSFLGLGAAAAALVVGGIAVASKLKGSV